VKNPRRRPLPQSHLKLRPAVPRDKTLAAPLCGSAHERRFCLGYKAMFRFMTREMFDALIIGVIVIGLVLAAIRLRQDLTRPLPPEDESN
jgi:hypothetical protein